MLHANTVEWSLDERAREFERPAERPRHARDLQLVEEVLRSCQDSCQGLVAHLTVVPRMLTALNARHGQPFGPHDLDDLTQDALLAAWQSLPRYRGESSLRTWLCGVARFTFLGALRGAGRRRARALAEPLDEEACWPDPRTVSDELDSDLLHDSLRRLGKRYATVIYLRHFESLSFQAIGRRVGAPTNTAKTRYHRGLVRLHAILRERLRERGDGSAARR